MSPSCQNLHSILYEELSLLEQLALTLEEENTAIRQHDCDTLLVVQASKHALAAQLDSCEETRASVLEIAGYTADKDGLEHFIQHQPWKDALIIEEVWERICDVLLACNEKNCSNQRLQDLQQQSTREMLSTLLARNTGAASGGHYGTRSGSPTRVGRIIPFPGSTPKS